MKQPIEVEKEQKKPVKWTEVVKRTDQTGGLERAEPAPSTAITSYGGYGDESAGHLRDYWRAMRKRLWLVISLTLITTMLVAIYVARKPDIYEAQARVQVDLENNLGIGNSSKNGSVIVNNPVSDPTYFNTQLQILTGPGLLRRVVKTLDLENNDAFLHPQSAQSRSTWQSLLRMFGLGGKDRETAKNAAEETVPLTTPVAPATSRDDLAEAKRLAPYVNSLLSSLKVEPVKETRTAYNRDTRLIDIRFDHADPQIAARVVNAIADAFVRTNLEKKTETGSTTDEFLQKRIAELQAEIRSEQEQLNEYAKSKEILSLDASQNTVVERLVGLNRQLLEAENDRKLAEAAYRAALVPGAATPLAESENKQIAEDESKLGELKQKRAQLLVEATEEAPEVKEVSEQIAVLERQIKDERSHSTSNILTNLETRYRSALAREESLRTAFNQQKGETVTQNEAAINYRIIQQEIDTNKSLLDGLLQRSKENEVVLAGTPNNIYVVDYALVPDMPVGPARLRIVILALLLSFCAGVGLALFLEYMDDSVHSTEEVQRLLSLPTLAAIPAAGSIARRRLRHAAGALQTRGDNVTHSELLLNVDPRSPLAEAYRHLRTSVLLSTAGRPPKTLLVTSSLPGEGKTTTAVNTAISLAQTGTAVVIVDADMRRPRLHSIFEIGNRKGLSTILSSEMDEAEMLSTIEQHETSGVYLLTSGPIPPNPAELIGSDQMRRLISVLETTFTHIIIDSPPINSFTDGVLISSMVDGVLMVVHSGRTSRHIVRRARQLLLDIGAKIFGVVLNNVNQHSQDYYYYQQYYKSSYYNREADVESLASDTQV
jgi:succinoglycan biosynthesis transport protein ExoP